MTIPLALEGKDVIGQAQTGTGKTAAFGLPTLDKIRTEENTIQALVIAPTRELAVQSQEELFRFGRDKALRFAQYTVVLASRNKSSPPFRCPHCSRDTRSSPRPYQT